MLTARFGLFGTAKESRVDNPHSLLFGKADFLFSITFVVSLVALIFSFSAVSGERESGTLRLTIASAVPRGRILLSKVAGIYLALLVPLILSVLLALLVLEASPDVTIFSTEVGPTFLVIFAVTALFLLAMVSLGICISTFTRRARDSMVLAFFAWALLILGVPKLSPMIADVLHPVESASTFDLTKRLITEDIDRELVKETEALEAKLFAKRGAPLEGTTGSTVEQIQAREEAEAELKREFPLLEEQYEQRLAGELRRIEQDYRRRTGVRSSLAMHLSRLSPACCYTYIVCGLAGAGATEPENFLRNAQRYQDRIKQEVYDKVTIIRTGWSAQYSYAEGFDERTTSLPDMIYTYPTLAMALQETWPDMALLFAFNVLFFAVAFSKLNRYDVR